MTELEWLDIFADNLASMMEESGYTQMDLAEETGLSQSTISTYLNKRKFPGVKAIINIAYALDCEVTELIDFDETIE